MYKPVCLVIIIYGLKMLLSTLLISLISIDITQNEMKAINIHFN